MVLTRPHLLSPWLLLLGASGCLRRSEPVRLPHAQPIAVAYVLDDPFAQEVEALPAAAVARIEEALAARNLSPQGCADPGFLPSLGRVRDSAQRLAALRGQLPAVEIALLVEAQARFSSLLSGRFRWDVHVKITASMGSDPPVTHATNLPAVLLFDHEREADAVAAVSSEIARRSGRLLDNLLSRLLPAPAPAGASLGSIYFILVDRFANGDPSNDGAVDLGDANAWHGGDLDGITAKLDDIQALGFDTLWLSPIFAARQAPLGEVGAFHGYWTEDVAQIAPRFGGEPALKRLLLAARARGMGVLLDWVVNHVGYGTPLVAARPDWFHHNGDITDWQDPLQLTDNDVHGLPDLAQENPAVFDYLREHAHHWLGLAGVRGFRLDAVKHVPVAFWQRYHAELRAQRADLVLLAEHFDGSPQRVAEVVRRGGFTHAFDFPLAFALRDVLCSGADPGAVGAVLSAGRGVLPDDAWVTFLDNHDLPRFRSACGDEVARLRHGLAALYALRGVPAVTYGTETGARGLREPANRGDMSFAPPPGDDLRPWLGQLAKLRRGHPALSHGETRIVAYRTGRLVLLRQAGEDAVLIALAGSEAQQLDLPTLLGVPAVEDAFSGAAVTGPVEVAAGGVALWLVPAPLPARWTRASAEPIRRPVRVVAREAPGRLRMVGSGAELGAWQPAAAPALDEPLALPVGALFAYKLVAEGAAGLRWESGNNRYLYIEEGDSELVVDVAFRG